MKKVLKVLGIIVGLVLLIVILSASYIAVSGIPTYDTPKVEFELKSSPEAIERGAKLVYSLCAGCHLNSETGKLTGKLMTDAPPEFGKIYSANVTQSNDYGIGSWTDQEIVGLLRTGIKRDGKYAPPYMAKLPHMADSDINAVIAFLRSEQNAAVETADFESEPSFLVKFLCRVAFKPFPMPDHNIELPDTNNTLELGKYLATNFECFSCHSADFKTNDYLEPEKSVGFYGGGNKILNLEGKVIPSANITPDHETGIGSWTKDEFVRALKTGKLEERTLRYPMLPYNLLTDKEAAAIFEYLQRVPALNHSVDRNL